MRTPLTQKLLMFLGLLCVGAWPLLVSGQSPVSLDRGKALYRGHCAACHGLEGDGNGPRAVGMIPAPTNFLDENVMNILSDNDLEQAILAGKGDTAMRAYGTIFRPEEVNALVQYLRSLSTSP